MMPVPRHEINYKLACLRQAAEDGTLWRKPSPKFADGQRFTQFATRYLVFNSTTVKRWGGKAIRPIFKADEK